MVSSEPSADGSGGIAPDKVAARWRKLIQAIDQGELMDQIPRSFVGYPEEKWRCCPVEGRGATGAAVTGCTVLHNRGDLQESIPSVMV